MSDSPTKPAATPDRTSFGFFYALVFGAFLGLALLKFGNPPIFEKLVTRPQSLLEYIFFTPWPIAWAYTVLAVMAAAGLFAARWFLNIPRWLAALPAVWLVWQFICASFSVTPGLTRVVLPHFLANVVCFYLGVFALNRATTLKLVWWGLFGALAFILMTGFEQHFGGLEQAHQYLLQYVLPKGGDIPPEYVKKMSSTRIFGTLFYPNSLAGALLLLVPPVLTLCWQLRRWFDASARLFIMGVIGLACLAALVWSGSKAGWLLMLLLGLLALLRMDLTPRAKRTIVGIMIVAGLSAFFVHYAGFFRKGATSVSARFDYWRAAAQTALAHPLFGSGPGTFATAYERLKDPRSEMARLAHNDYLEQASDSGFIGAALYAVWIAGAMVCAFPFRPRTVAKTGLAPANPRSQKPLLDELVRSDENWFRYSIWLGLLGWALQCFVEFNFYQPSLTWPALALLGMLAQQITPEERARLGECAAAGLRKLQQRSVQTPRA